MLKAVIHILSLLLVVNAHRNPICTLNYLIKHIFILDPILSKLRLYSSSNVGTIYSVIVPVRGIKMTGSNISGGSSPITD